MSEREILEFSNRGGVGHPNIYYVEGNSPFVDATEGGGNWFCFEEPMAVAVRELRKLGFTWDEIREARRREEVT